MSFTYALFNMRLFAESLSPLGFTTEHLTQQNKEGIRWN